MRRLGHLRDIVETMEVDTRTHSLLPFGPFLFCFYFSQFFIAVTKYSIQLIYQDRKFALALEFCGSLWWVLSDTGVEYMAGASKATLPASVGVRGSHSKQESRVLLGPYIPSRITLPKIFRSPARVTLPKLPHTSLVPPSEPSP